MTDGRSDFLGKRTIDWWSVAIYAALVIFGWINIYAAVYTEASSGLFNLSQRYGMQMIWIGLSLAVAVVILLLDDKYYHMFAYPLYGAAILLLVAVLVVGREVNGAKAWIFIGSVAIQPTELVKFTTSLALARYMSRFSFSIHKDMDLFKLALIILIPVTVIMLQPDTGSALVYGAFFMVFYREGMNGWVYVVLFMAVAVFIASFLLTPATIVIGLILICVLGEGILNGRWREKVIYLSALALATLLLYYAVPIIFKVKLSLFAALLISCGLSLPMALVYAFRNKLRNVYYFILLFIASIGFSLTVDYVFDNVMPVHQQQRLLHVLGLESDLQKWGYNVNQSKIAIGSGGFTGKGFLSGTQTRFDFVPEQSTDFIFCTVGEEWGFLGSAGVVILFCLLVLRLMKMGERQSEPFGRIYCYCVASIFFVHAVINIGMTIGLLPVIGIPLPFFSYGGSSLLAFTILFFVAVKLDAGRREVMRSY